MDEVKIAALSRGGLHCLRSGKWPELDAIPIEDRDDPAVHPAVELELDPLALDGDRSGCARRRRRQRKDGEQDGGRPPRSRRAQKYSRKPHWISRIGEARPVIVPPESLSMKGSGWAKFARLAMLNTSMRNSSPKSWSRANRLAR